MFKKVLRRIREKGFIGGTKYFVKKITGREKLEDEIDTLYYFLNAYADVTKVPKANGALRKMQECDAVLLKIFHNVCVQNGLTYWLDSGTLLGAVRHGGFIPWDDDMDVVMPREDYDKALSIFPELLKEFGIDVNEFKERPMMSFGFSYKHKETGIWLDVFPVDQLRTDGESRDAVDGRLSIYKKYYYKNRFKVPKVDLLTKKKDVFDNEKITDCSKTSLVVSPEWPANRFFVYNYSDVYPLQMISFEGEQYFCPGNTDAYLTELYGRNYMGFPRNGVLHHGSGEVMLYERAAVYGVSMGTILDEMAEIEKKTRQGEIETMRGRQFAMH